MAMDGGGTRVRVTWNIPGPWLALISTGPITGKHAPVKQVSRECAKQRGNLHSVTIEPANIRTGTCCGRVPRHVRREGAVFHGQESYRYCFGTYLCRLSRDSNGRASARVETRIGGHECSCYENGWLPVLSVTCCLSRCFDGSHHHVWDLDDRDVEHDNPAHGSNKGRRSGRPLYFWSLPRQARRGLASAGHSPGRQLATTYGRKPQR
jgi:hypothetical protein